MRCVKPFDPADRPRLQAAEGWVGLGDYAAANDELEQVTASNRSHPDVLQLRWRIYPKKVNGPYSGGRCYV